MNIRLVTEHQQQCEEETVTSGTQGVSSPTAALAPFSTRVVAFLPLKAGNPSWPHLPAPSRPSSWSPSSHRPSELTPGSASWLHLLRVTSGRSAPTGAWGLNWEGHSLGVTAPAGSNLSKKKSREPWSPIFQPLF